MSLELVVFTGMPGSGKSSFYRTRFAESHTLVSKDLFPNARNKDRRQRTLIEEAFAAGRSVVVDNTNPTIENRGALIDLARLSGAKTVGYVFEADVESCLSRNALRTGRARVPDVAIFHIARRLVRPRHAEGFDELFRVTLIDGGFDVQPVEGEQQP